MSQPAIAANRAAPELPEQSKSPPDQPRTERPCKRCAAAAEVLPTLSWKQVDQRYREAWTRLNDDDTEHHSTPSEATT